VISRGSKETVFLCTREFNHAGAFSAKVNRPDPRKTKIAPVIGAGDQWAMQKEEITAIFDRQASSYDQKWSELAPLNSALHLLAGSVLSTLPTEAEILCVGAGTGTEILFLAQKFPGWRFTAVEPSRAMLDVFRRRAEESGISSRCVFHHGYLDALPKEEGFDAATAFLVSQFLLDREDRMRFFQGVAGRLRPEGILVSSDLAGDLAAADCRSLLTVWFRLMKGSGVSPAEIERMRAAYVQDVAVLPPGEVREMIRLAGFELPVQFFQAGMIHAWYARRA
jgi:tRNA (cmo5U34)-methyltransferase